jgi:hypothetical protein
MSSGRIPKTTQPPQDPMRETAEALCRLSPRSKFAKKYRQIELERLYLEFIMEHERYPGSAELAKALNVSPRTVRNYLRERRERLHGPAQVWVHWQGDDGKPARPPEFLTVDEYAKRTGFSIREVRRRIWEQRRDSIAQVRKQFEKDSRPMEESKHSPKQGKPEEN